MLHALVISSLQKIAVRTLAHCEQNAQSFLVGTRSHDVSQNIPALLKHIAVPLTFDLLDSGCGLGRDLRTLKEMGCRAAGLESATSLVAIVRAHSGR